MHEAGHGTREIAEALFEDGARASTSDPNVPPFKLTREHHIKNLRRWRCTRSSGLACARAARARDGRTTSPTSISPDHGRGRDMSKASTGRRERRLANKKLRTATGNARIVVSGPAAVRNRGVDCARP